MEKFFWVILEKDEFQFREKLQYVMVLGILAFKVSKQVWKKTVMKHTLLKKIFRLNPDLGWINQAAVFGEIWVCRNSRRSKHNGAFWHFGLSIRTLKQGPEWYHCWLTTFSVIEVAIETMMKKMKPVFLGKINFEYPVSKMKKPGWMARFGNSSLSSYQWRRHPRTGLLNGLLQVEGCRVRLLR